VQAPDAPDPTPPFQRANRPLRALALAENVLMFALLAGTVGVILAQVFFRYLLDQPLSWSNEAATDLLVYVAFVGFAIGIRDNAHVALNLFETRLGVLPRRVLRIGELLVLGVVLVCIGIGGATYMIDQSDVVSPVGIPLWAAFLPLPLGAVLGSVHLIVEIVALLRGAEPPGQRDVVPEDLTNDTDRPAPATPGGAA
jgi:TRAP-type C4-dicarboxylate transport system permease small subunit